jgi:acetyl-CoA carboxylase biotin carboxyl carrier protein
MDINEIKELIKAIDSSSITEFQLDKENFKILIKKEQGTLQVLDGEYTESKRRGDLVEKVIELEEKTTDIKQEEKNMHLIKSPIVGMFYSSPSPDEEVFVKAGNNIKRGDVLCIIEAMKLMNEVTADIDGEIIEVLVENKSIVEYGQPLFKVRKV